MKHSILACLCIAVLLSTPAVLHAEEEKPVQVNIQVNAGLGPSSSLYILDTLFERISIWLANTPEDEVDTLLKFANEKMEEMGEAAESDEKAATTASKRYQKYIAEAVKKAERAQKDGKDVDPQLQKISSESLQHISALVTVGEKVATAEAPYIEDALNTIQEQEKKVLPLIQDKDKRAEAVNEVVAFLQETEKRIPETVRNNIQETLSSLLKGISAVILEQGNVLLNSLGESAKEYVQRQVER